jgi:hypothetical protein
MTILSLQRLMVATARITFVELTYSSTNGCNSRANCRWRLRFEHDSSGHRTRERRAPTLSLLCFAVPFLPMEGASKKKLRYRLFSAGENHSDRESDS